MKFNPLQRGKKREENTKEALYEVLDAGFVCTLSVNVDGIPMMIPTSYGRKNDCLYLHGSSKNHLFLEALKSEQICISVHHTDGLVLAQTLFNTGLNYRSAVLFGRAEKVEKEEERMEALKVITEQVIPGRWDEVEVGTPEQLNVTLILKVKIESATVKIRKGGPNENSDLNKEVWSGVIPLQTVALPPEYDNNRLQEFEEDDSITLYYLKHKFNA